MLDEKKFSLSSNLNMDIC